MLTVLEEDFARLPALLGREVIAEAEDEPESALVASAPVEPAEQLGLF
jgi:hypothetical protein